MGWIIALIVGCVRVAGQPGDESRRFDGGILEYRGRLRRFDHRQYGGRALTGDYWQRAGIFDHRVDCGYFGRGHPAGDS